MERAMVPTFFATPAEFRAWFEAEHERAQDVWVGFYKKGSGRPSITWPEAVDEALCFGWIDGVRRSLDDASYVIGFTSRKPRSTWSAVNIKRVEELTAQGRMRPAGLAAFAKRAEDQSGSYAYEQGDGAHELAATDEQQFRANRAAWDFFQARPAWYRRPAIWWVISAKRDETKQKRLATLIADSEQGRTIARLTRPAGLK
jgi:uncharacterized protein YdeI (YjbR/CyaY-like superfamily)